MKIKSLSIKEHKILKDIDISFADKDGKPLDTVVIAGINGSGKTTALELIWSIVSNGKEIKEIKEAFFIDQIEGEIRVSINDLLKNFPKADYMKSRIFYLKVFESDKEFVISNIKNLLETIKDKNENLTVKEANQKAVDEINSIFEGLELKTRFKGLSKDINREILFENNTKDDIKLDELSTGEQQLFIRALGLKMMEPKDSIILIDEPEISLHPNWQNLILRVYQNIAKAGNNQLIVATHSPQIISSTPNESLRLLVNNGEKIEVKTYANSYGTEIEAVLQDIMGTQYLRAPQVALEIEKMWEYLNKEDLEGFEQSYSDLSKMLDINDKDLVLARLKKARILSQK